MGTEREVYYTKMLDSQLDHNYHHVTPFSSKKLQEAVSRVMEAEEKGSESNLNTVTINTLFQSPVTITTQKKYANVTNERQIASDIHA